MKRSLLLLICMMFPLAHLFAENGNLKKYEIEIGGMIREYTMYTPENLPPKAPLLLVLHGYGGHSGDLGKIFYEIADRERFAICMPQGAPDLQGRPAWNMHYDFQIGMKGDDIEYLSKLVRIVQKKFNLNKKNSFCVGKSNGGDMTYYMVHTHPELFTAAANIVGVLMVDVRKNHDYNTRNSVPFMQFHGTKDQISFWEGDLDGSEGYGAWYPVPDAVEYMAKAAGCKENESYKLPHKKGKEVIFHRYYDGGKSKKKGVDKEVHFYEVTDGGHGWYTEDINMPEIIWDFFKKYMR